MIRGKRTAGLTLFEVVLALGLVVVVMAAGLSLQRHVARLREEARWRAGRIESARGVMDMITRELRSARVDPFLNIGMDGEAQAMRFIRATVPSRAVWAIPARGETSPASEHDLELVGWRLAIEEDQSTGRPRIAGLQRTNQKLLTARESEEGDNVESALIAPGIRFLAVRYWEDGTWLSSWGGGDLPLAVEITLGFEPLPEDLPVEAYPYDTFRRVVYLPAAAGSRPETTGPRAEDRG